MRHIPCNNCIETFIHCSECLQILPPNTSPREWADLEVGFTPLGLQIWCKRHECNVVHIDFEKKRHPANTSRRESVAQPD